MSQLSIYICKNRQEAVARKKIIKAGNPSAKWFTRIIEGIDDVSGFLSENIDQDPENLAELFPLDREFQDIVTILLVWTE